MPRASTNLAQWGSSLGVRIPKAILDAAHLKAGDQVEIEVQNRAIVIQAAVDTPTLEQLLDAITPENCHPATDWEKPAGTETW
jgi:antitoxin MazE